MQLSESDKDSIINMAPGAIKRINNEQATNSRYHKELALKPEPIQSDWGIIYGDNVLRIKNSKYIAAPLNGKKNCSNFGIINLDDRNDFICFLNKKEVQSWLYKAYQSEIK